MTMHNAAPRARLSRGAAAVALAVTLAFSAAADAQPVNPLFPGGTLSELIQFTIVDDSPDSRLADGRPVGRRGGDLRDALARGISLGISTVPTGSASAGFTFVFDPQTRERTLKSQSFGPLFVERGMTNGEGVFSFSATYHRSAFDQLAGIDLEDPGILVFDNRVRFTRDNFTQFIEEYITLDTTVNTFTTVVGYGLTSSFDIGVAVPVHSMDVTMRRTWDYDVSRNFANDAGTRQFFGSKGPVGTRFDQKSGTVSASGIGDITVRGKYAFGSQSARALAALIDVRLPTGDEENLLGAGKTSTRVGFVATAPLAESVSFHANAGYRMGGLSNETTYGVGLDAALLPTKKLTVSAELIGQYVEEAPTGFRQEAGEGGSSPGNDFNPPQPFVVSRDFYFAEVGGANIAQAAAALKYNIAGNALLSGGVLFPIGDSGLTSKYTIFVGLDFSISAR
jgi:hypothetical protein